MNRRITSPLAKTWRKRTRAQGCRKDVPAHRCAPCQREYDTSIVGGTGDKENQAWIGLPHDIGKRKIAGLGGREPASRWLFKQEISGKAKRVLKDYAQTDQWMLFAGGTEDGKAGQGMGICVSDMNRNRENLDSYRKAHREGRSEDYLGLHCSSAGCGNLCAGSCSDLAVSWAAGTMSYRPDGESNTMHGKVEGGVL